MKRLLSISVIALAASVSAVFAYTKPVTYKPGYNQCLGLTNPGCVVPGAIVFKEQLGSSPHSWVIQKAIALLMTDGYQSEANLAQKYLLPMLEGVTFNDVWGDADLAGGSVLDYYDPDSPGSNYGYGCVLDGFVFAPYKDCTSAFAAHPLYGYSNAAEHAQFRYDYGERIYTGKWGTDSRDLMAGWVVDTLFGQDDPMDGRWASGAYGIINATAPDGTQSRFGTNTTPATALYDLFFNRTNVESIFPDQTDDALANIHVSTDNVFNVAPDWLDSHYGNADSVEAFEGWDGIDSAVYANWTLDAAGHCYKSGPTCAAPMVVRLPVGSKAHAFFQLGWAIHLLEDNTTPVHTVNGSIEAFERHNDIEQFADYEIVSASVTAGNVRDLLPALNSTDFAKIYDWPPPTPASGDTSCPGLVTNPSSGFHTRWWTDTLSPNPGEGVAHAYTRQVAETSHKYIPYIECINTEDDANLPSMGFFTSYGLDNAIKATAGLIRQFIEDIEDVDKTPPSLTILQPAATTYPHSGTLTLNYTAATDDESGIKTPDVATLDGQTTVGGHGLASGQVINFLADNLALGPHTFTVRAVDNAGNVSAPSVTFSIVVTPASIISDVNYYLSTGAITVNNEANSLIQKLNAGAAYRAAGDCKDANEVYQSFISELLSQSGKKVTKAAATVMIADAQYLIANCP